MPLQDPNIKAAIGALRRPLERAYESSKNRINAGRIEIEYYSQEELQRLYEWIVSTGSKD
jgi:hypothetical protein